LIGPANDVVIVRASDLELADNRELGEDGVLVVEATFTRLPLPDYPLWTEPKGETTVRWLAGVGAVLRDDADMWL
jgi:hypothetical protein